MSQKWFSTRVSEMGLRHSTVRVLTPHPHVAEHWVGNVTDAHSTVNLRRCGIYTGVGGELFQIPLKHLPPPQLPSAAERSVHMKHYFQCVSHSISLSTAEDYCPFGTGWR